MKALLLAVLMVGCAEAGTLASVTGGVASNESYGPTQYTAQSWTMPFAANNISIAATLFAPSASSVTAYLGTSLGPGSSALNSASFNLAGSANQFQQTLFSGLSLGPGTYYLVLASSSANAGAWSFTSNGTKTTAPGVSIAGGTITTSLNAGNPIASDFFANGSFEYLFSVTGDVVPGSTVPEPSSALLSLAGFWVLVLRTRRKR